LHNLLNNQFIFLVIDLSPNSATCNEPINLKKCEKTTSIYPEGSFLVSSSEKCISDKFAKAFPKPSVNGVKKRKRKMQMDENTPICSTVDEMLKVLERKESAKKLKEEQLKQKQVNRAKKKALKDQELLMRRKFNEKKKNIILQRKELNLRIKNVKQLLKSTNEVSLKNELHSLESQLENLDRLIKIEELTILQNTLQIKKEIV